MAARTLPRLTDRQGHLTVGARTRRGMAGAASVHNVRAGQRGGELREGGGDPLRGAAERRDHDSADSPRVHSNDRGPGPARATESAQAIARSARARQPSCYADRLRESVRLRDPDDTPRHRCPRAAGPPADRHRRAETCRQADQDPYRSAPELRPGAGIATHHPAVDRIGHGDTGVRCPGRAARHGGSAPSGTHQRARSTCVFR